MGNILPPGSVVGIVGGGQLGRMLATAAARLGLRASIFEPQKDAPAFDAAAFRHCAPYDDVSALEAFAQEADVVTLEFENVPVSALEIIERYTPVFPPRQALQVAQDRIAEKAFITSLGLPLGAYEPVEGADALGEAYARLVARAPGTAYLKRARHGYDGKGQMRLVSADDIPAAESWLGAETAVLEAAVPFAMEISMLAVRGADGAMAFYDPPHNTHAEGILRECLVPAPISAATRTQAENYARRIAEALDYVGVLAIELFLVREADGNEHLLLNEIAPRVHNSGHWTADTCTVGQFENHIRAVAGWPLGSTARHSEARMVNLLGHEALEWRTLLTDNPARMLTLYGKSDVRSGRKMGHYVDLSPLVK
ncbi:MAG: 5-(carboxyamino)imidazole ribonucleotide synthase [Alphaproteobacteria bacterium]